MVVTKKEPEPAPPTNGQTENTDRRFVWLQGTESSYNLGSKPQLSALPAHPLPPALLQRSELAASHEKFTPIVGLSKYPYKFCNKDCMQAIATAFFDRGQFWAREWDLYYLWDIEESKPLILVHESQVHDLLEEINSRFKLELKITDSQREEGLVLRFPDHPRCRPRYLGRSHTRDEYNSMTDQVPLISVRAPGEPTPPSLDAQAIEDFRQMIEDAWEVTRNKTKASKEKRRVDRLKKQKVFTDQLKRAQRYLGLRPSTLDGTSPTAISAVDVTRSAPFPYDRSVIFICVDVEAYEKDHSKITEVGIATLDTRDLMHVAPGKDGEAWRSLIKARHFRVKEYAHLVNNEYVAGCPSSFFFGKSDFVPLKDLLTSVAACFTPSSCADPGRKLNGGDSDQRNLILLGHDTLTDVKYLQDIGFDPLTLPNLLEAHDSANLYRVWQRQEQTTKLAKILEGFDIDYFGLHNAGNDAVYTVQSFLAICVREASIRNSLEVQQIWNDRKESKLAFEQDELRSDIEKDAKVWDDLEANGDGGEPVPIVLKKQATPNAKKASSTSVNVGGGCNGTFHPASAGGRDDQGRSNGSLSHDGIDGRSGQRDNSDGWGGSAVW
ncbi:hypothetical protein P171DRAFT_362217 [Karstenula rhodostoma CBS 690.94]|uniref:Gfd2/YDR514C-like C-terminal domain-containing protein n=1 Tax=Karstenula rhodostoma CBS 690.94 TaxID=1392251 RepID=A0A9P4UBL9_9PLEO|nr:hypothetical protein P171DRAFT_362217 [Karstenula rhodostoma CBS 690.94]